MYYMDCFSAVIKYLMWIGCAFCEIINRLITSTPLCIIKLEWCGVPFLKVSDTFSLRGCLLTIFDVFVYFFLNVLSVRIHITAKVTFLRPLSYALQTFQINFALMNFRFKDLSKNSALPWRRFWLRSQRFGLFRNLTKGR